MAEQRRLDFAFWGENIMFSVREKREISEAIQKVLRATNHKELPEGEIEFCLEVAGEASWSWAKIENNGAIKNPSVNPHNELMDDVLCVEKFGVKIEGEG